MPADDGTDPAIASTAVNGLISGLAASGLHYAGPCRPCGRRDAV
jgi:hypothetical protein